MAARKRDWRCDVSWRNLGITTNLDDFVASIHIMWNAPA